MSVIGKIVGVLIIAILAIAIVSYIVATQPPSPQPTPTPSPSPTEGSPTPTFPAPTPTPTPPLTEQEIIRDSVVNYIKSNRPETAQFMNDLVWTGGRATPENVVGSETYMYYADGWNFTMNYPVVLQPVYSITADYKAPGIGIPYRVIWEGTWQNQVIKETNYIFAQ